MTTSKDAGNIKEQESKGALPVELVLQILEHLTTPGAAPRDIAALRLSSRLLCRLATPHFYKVIELASFAHGKALATQLHAQPELSNTTRAVWWDELPKKATDFGVHFPNVEEVAFCYKTTSDRAPKPYMLGVNYALRDAGPWCEPVNFTRPAGPVAHLQSTPTIDGLYFSHGEGWRSQLKRAQQYKEEWLEKNGDAPWVGPPYPWTVAAQLNRVIWAAHLVVPALFFDNCPLYDLPKTITHLTISVYTHPKVGTIMDPSIGYVVESILETHNLPLLEHFEVRLLRFVAEDKEKTGNEEPASKLSVDDGEEGWSDEDEVDDDDELIEARADVFESALDHAFDSRVYFTPMIVTVPSSSELLDDTVRNYALGEWKHRVYKGLWGAWQDPLTEKVRPEGARELYYAEEEESPLDDDDDDEDE